MGRCCGRTFGHLRLEALAGILFFLRISSFPFFCKAFRTRKVQRMSTLRSCVFASDVPKSCRLMVDGQTAS